MILRSVLCAHASLPNLARVSALKQSLSDMIADKTQAGSPASIAAVGMALATLPLAAERAHLPRELMAEREWQCRNLASRPLCDMAQMERRLRTFASGLG
jgi:hypothetical protein